jgi:lipid A oxidase
MAAPKNLRRSRMQIRHLPLRTRFVAIAVAAILISTVSSVDKARAELRLSAYSGLGTTADSDVKLEQQGGTNLTFNDVNWEHQSLKAPIYYGLRLNYWFESAPSWGVGVDFTHAKMIAQTGQVVTVTGTRAGNPVASPEPLGNTITNFQFSHGHNLLTLNGFHRWFFGDRVEPYVGFGFGVAIPHVEATVDGIDTQEYQVAGPAGQGLAGINLQIYGPLSLFAEYKLSYARLEADLQSAGTLRVRPWTHHFILGISFNLF